MDFEEKYAISLQKDTLEKVMSMLQDSSLKNEIEISAALLNKTKIDFADFDELLSHNNSKDDRIETLDIRNFDDSNNNVKIKFNVNDFGFFKQQTASISITKQNKAECTALRDRFREILREAQMPKCYNFLSIINVQTVLFVMATFGVATYMALMGWTVTSILFAIFVLLGLVFWGIKCIVMVQQCLFSPLIFLWGDEIKRQEKLGKTRNSIFWFIIGTVIFGIIIGVVANILSRYI